MIGVTARLLQDALRCSAELAERFAAPLHDACRFYGIDTPARLAAFFAQIGHESGALRHTAEVWGPTEAQQRYEGRADLGNNQRDDGYRFRGRGLIQTTGRANYRELTRRLRARGVECPDFERDPDELQAPWWAALSAADYWDSRSCNRLADDGDFAAITRRINGGLNGQADRLARWDVAKAALAALPPQAPPKSKEAAMPIPAIVGALLPVLTSAVPELVKLIKPGSESAAQNAAVATKVFEVAQAALGAANAQDVAERVASDPAAAQTVREAVQAQWFTLAELMQVAEADEHSRTAAADRNVALSRETGGRWLWLVGFVAALIVVASYCIVTLVLLRDGFSEETRALLLGQVVILGFGTVVTFLFGSSLTSKLQGMRESK